MRFLIAICCLFCVHANKDYRLPVPGCTVVELDSQNADCFTHSNGDRSYPTKANAECAKTGGQLAIIQHEKVWKALIEKLLKPKNKPVLLGFNVIKFTEELLPNIDLSNMSSYWNESRVRHSSWHQYILAEIGKWQWYLIEDNGAYDFLCQYKVVMQCGVKDIVDPKLIVKTCVENDDIIPNKASLEVKCPSGYYLNTSRFKTCRNGIWDKSQCLPGCPPPLPRDFAVLNTVPNIFNIGDKITYECEDGYYNWKDFRKTHFAITCQKDSTWSNEDSRCSLRQEYTTININANDISTDELLLKCELPSNNTIWIHNGEEITNSDIFTVMDTGVLRVNIKAANSTGFYICHAEIDQILRVSSQAYHVFNTTQLEPLPIKETVCRERETIILACPQENGFVSSQIKWFKEGKGIIYNSNQNILVGGALLLQNTTAQDDGNYVCETTHAVDSHIRTRKITHNLRVILSAKTICGTRNEIQTRYYQPWLTILWQEDEIEPFCFGTLLNEKWVVTSAFCLTHLRRKKNLDGVYAVLGSRGKRQKFPISRIEIHPNYKTRPNVHDIGLIQLRVDEIKFDNDVIPACFCSEDVGDIHACEDSSNLKGSVIGWGTKTTDFIDDVTTNIGEGKMISKKLCRELLSYDSAQNKFCTKSNDEDEIYGVTAGFGSPFTASRNNREYLVGIYTWGKNNGSEHYEYYTSTLNYYDWITKMTNY